MHLRIPTIILICSLLCTVYALSPEKLRNHFEWGEYQQLISTLEPYLSSPPDTLGANRSACYHCYLGVAYFGAGRVSDARKQFSIALSYDSSVKPDKNYISKEINDLFIATVTDFTEEKKRRRTKDSLTIVRQQAFDANLQALKQEKLRKSRKSSLLLGVSLLTVGAAFAGIAAYEYYTTKEPYHDFKRAAANGDKLNYDRLRPSIRRANGIIFSCAIAASLSEIAGMFLSIRSLTLK